MARRSEPLSLTNEERLQLTSMMALSDNTTTERIRIVLACADEPSNKNVALTLHTDEHKVAKWKEAYRKEGISGLETAKGRGRKPRNSVSNLEESILHLIEDESKEWTVQLLAKELNVSSYQISSILKSHNISLGRKRQWCYETLDSVTSADIEVIGLYVSAQACIAVTCYYPYGMHTAPGIFTTGNRKMAEKLEQASNKLTVGDVLAEAQYYPCVTCSFSTPELFVSQCLESITEDQRNSKMDGMEYHLFIWSKDAIRSKKILPEHVFLKYYNSPKEILLAIHSWAGGLTSAAHLYEIELLVKSIESYLNKSEEEKEHLWWKKALKGIGSEDTPMTYSPWKENRAQPGIEEWIQQLIQGDLSESEIQSGMIAFVKDADGFSYKTIMSKDALPGTDQFAFDSEEGFLHGMNQLEKVILKMRDEAGIATTDIYLDQIKKNKTRSES